MQCRDLRKTYDGRVEAVRGLSLEIQAGECFGLLGPNGAFPVTLALFMRSPEYYTAPLFLVAVILVGVISLMTIVAAWLVRRGGYRL